MDNSGAINLVSVNCGLPRQVLWRSRSVTTSIYKEPVKGRVALRTLNIDGDRQADLTVHGGLSKAVYCYPVSHYEYWKAESPVRELPLGSFGENFTVAGLVENSVHIGDRFAVGSAEVIVTEPRLPCYKLGVRFESDEMGKRFLASRRSGFYVAVVREGDVGAGDKIVMTGRELGSFPSPGSCDYTSLRAIAIRTLRKCGKSWRLRLCLAVGRSIFVSDWRVSGLEMKKKFSPSKRGGRGLPRLVGIEASRAVARERRRKRYRPDRVRILFVGESPPSSGRFFYQADSGLYRAVRETFIQAFPPLKNTGFLDSFCTLGCYLIDLCSEPVDKMTPKARRYSCRIGEKRLAQKIRALHPQTIVTVVRSIRANVRHAQERAGWSGRYLELPYPGRWHRHRVKFRKLLVPFLRQTFTEIN